jgi:DNA-binding MarR family transcriptional regulator
MKDEDVRESILIWFKLSRIYSDNLKESNQILKAYGISLGQFDVIAQLGIGREITQNELSEKLLVTKGNISQLLASLEEAGLVCRRQVWKTKYVSLTEKGITLHDEVVPLLEAFQHDTFGVLEKEEKTELLRLLRKLGRRTNQI